jgi:hypothetical protein
MDKVVPFFKSFPTIFYLKIQAQEGLFWTDQSLKKFEPKLNSFEFEVESK